MRPSTTRRRFPPRRERAGIFIRLFASLTLTGLLASPLHPLAAQEAASVGRVTGRVVDAASGAGLSEVTVRVVGANVGASKLTKAEALGTKVIDEKRFIEIIEQ